MPSSRCGPIPGFAGINSEERIALQQNGEEFRTGRTGRHEQAELPRNDLGHEPERLESVDHPVREAGEFYPEITHHLDAAEREPVLQLQDRPAVEHGCGCVRRSECRGRAVDGLRDHAGVTNRPMTRSPASVCSR